MLRTLFPGAQRDVQRRASGLRLVMTARIGRSRVACNAFYFGPVPLRELPLGSSSSSSPPPMPDSVARLISS